MLTRGHTGNFRARIVTLLALAALVTVHSVGINVAHAGKPGGGGGTTLPPVRFQVHVLATTNFRMIYGSNNQGQMVGDYVDGNNRRHACAVNAIAGVVVDLNTVVAPPQGWYLATAFDMNDQGTIVGALGEIGVPITDSRRGFILRQPPNSPPVLELIPDQWEYTFAVRVNEDDTVLGAFDAGGGQSYGYYIYDPVRYGPNVTVLPFQSYYWNPSLNNSQIGRPAQVAGNLTDGRTFRYTLGDSAAETFSFTTSANVGGINDVGWFCGQAARTTKGSGPAFQAFRFRTTFEQFTASNNSAGAINNSGDLAISANYKLSAQLYREGSGLLNINDLIVGDSVSVADWRNASTTGSSGFAGITERGSVNPAMSGYPAITGALGTPVGTTAAFILVPVAP